VLVEEEVAAAATVAEAAAVSEVIPQAGQVVGAHHLLVMAIGHVRAVASITLLDSEQNVSSARHLDLRQPCSHLVAEVTEEAIEVEEITAMTSILVATAIVEAVMAVEEDPTDVIEMTLAVTRAAVAIMITVVMSAENEEIGLTRQKQK